MSALLDNIRDGNRNDCRDILRRKSKREAILASVDLIEDLMDSGSSALNAIDNVRRLVERL
jgi:hypothetical protein